MLYVYVHLLNKHVSQSADSSGRRRAQKCLQEFKLRCASAENTYTKSEFESGELELGLNIVPSCRITVRNDFAQTLIFGFYISSAVETFLGDTSKQLEDVYGGARFERMCNVLAGLVGEMGTVIGTLRTTTHRFCNIKRTESVVSHEQSKYYMIQK